MWSFITTCFSHLENSGSFNYADLPNVDLFHHTIFFKKQAFVSITFNFISNVFTYWETVKLIVANTGFYKTLIFILSLATNTASFVVVF